MKISVVVPCYNAEQYLRETLESIGSQTVRPHEVLVVDDGSTDESLRIAEEWGAKVHSNPENKGIGYTRQKGLEMAEGSHVAFLSSDDAYDPLFLELSLQYLRMKRATYTDYFRCDSSLVPFETFRAPEYSREEVVSWALKKNMFINFSSVIVPKDISTTFTEVLRHGEDLIFLLDSLIDGLEWVKVPHSLVNYRLHAQQGTKTQDPSEFMQLWRYIRSRLPSLGVPLQVVEKAYRDSLKKYRFATSPLGRLHRMIRSLLISDSF